MSGNMVLPVSMRGTRAPHLEAWVGGPCFVPHHDEGTDSAAVGGAGGSVPPTNTRHASSPTTGAAEHLTGRHRFWHTPGVQAFRQQATDTCTQCAAGVVTNRYAGNHWYMCTSRTPNTRQVSTSKGQVARQRRRGGYQPMKPHRDVRTGDTRTRQGMHNTTHTHTHKSTAARPT